MNSQPNSQSDTPEVTAFVEAFKKYAALKAAGKTTPFNEKWPDVKNEVEN